MKAFRVWEKLLTNKHLQDRYKEKIKNKSSAGIDRITCKKFEDDFDENLDIIQKKIMNNTYNFTRYKQLLCLKGANKNPRKISIPTIRDKLTLSILDELLFAVYGNKCRTEMPQMLMRNIIEDISEYKYYIKLDIETFYASILHDKLIRMLKYKIRKKEIINLIQKAIETSTIDFPVGKKVKNKKGIPEGLSISNALANLYLIETDKKYLLKEGISYFRYVDDILILMNKNEFTMIKAEIKNDFEAIGLEFNNSKVSEGTLEQGVEYLGYYISSNFIGVRKGSILKLEQSIEQLLKEIRRDNIDYIQWRLNLKITGFIWDNKKYGWLFFYSQIDDYKILYHLDNTIQKLLKRYHVEEKIKVKRFSRTLMEIQKALHTTSYIPNIDLLSREDKLKILLDISYLDLKDESDESIDGHFRKIMKKEIQNIERDVQNIS